MLKQAFINIEQNTFMVFFQPMFVIAKEDAYLFILM
jgi:hypothetical protein